MPPRGRLPHIAIDVSSNFNFLASIPMTHSWQQGILLLATIFVFNDLVSEFLAIKTSTSTYGTLHQLVQVNSCVETCYI